MKVKQIVETTSAGAIASVATPLGATQKRAGSLFKGKKTKKKFYEGKMKELAYDIQYLDNGNFQKKYKKTKEEMKKILGNPPPIKEDEIVEADLIVVPGQTSRREKGFIPHDKVRTDHEVEMARSDLFQAAKNAQKVYNLIKNISEDQGLEGWVQEKIIKANDYLNTIREYLEHKTLAEHAQLQYYNVLVYDAEDGEFYVEVTASSDEEAHNKAMYIAKHKYQTKPIGTDIQYPYGPPQQSNEGGGVIAGGMSNAEESVAEEKFGGMPYDRLQGLQDPRGSQNFKGSQGLTINQLAAVSDEALDKAYGYGRSSPGNTFGWQANLKSAEYAKKAIMSGITDIEKISDMIHKGWNVTAKAFVQNPDQFSDTEKLKASGKLEAKLAQRKKLMNIEYSQLPEEEKEKDRVVARALLQALTGKQGVAEEKLDEKKDACYSKVKSRYKVWPSAYASGALSKCRKVGANNWGNKSKK